MRKFIFILPIMLLAACTDESGAIRTAENHGFSNVRATGYRFTGCSDNDVFRTGFTATNASGRVVSGVVCSSWLKSNTLRLD